MCKKGGTKLTEIDLISQQILTHEKEIVNDIQVWLPALLTFGASLIIAFNVALSTHVHRKLAGSLSFSVAGIALIIFTISTIDTTEIRNEITDLEEQRIDLLKLDIQAMSCEDIRLNIIKVMENKTTPDYKLQVFDYEKDYYYHKCEIPLREEVIKLQKDGLQ